MTLQATETRHEVPQQRPVRSAIIGTGFMGRVHAHAVRAAGGTITAVAGTSLDKARSAGTQFGASFAFNSATEALTSDDVDLVHICTPNDTHHALALAAIEAGKHVVCEKPLATDPAATAELVEAASRHGVQAVVPFVYRFYPSVRRARAMAASGELGALHLLHGSYLQDWLASADSTNWRVDNATGGRSRAFADIGVHWCDLVEFTSGHRITRLSASVRTVYPHRGGTDPGAAVLTEDAALVSFETDRGAAGSLVVSQVSHGRKNRLSFSLDGVTGSVAFNQEEPDTLWTGGLAANETIPRAAAPFSPDVDTYDVLPAGHPQGYQDCFNALVRDAHSAIRGEHPDGLPTFADGHRAALLTDAVLRSAATNTWVEVTS